MMEIRNVLSRKPAKLLILLLLNMLVVTASAAIYYGMILQPGITTTPALVQFEQGTDWPTGSPPLGANGTWASLSLNAYPNVTLTYEEPINVSNTDSSAHDIRLRHVSMSLANGSAPVGNFTKIAFILVDETGSSVASFNYTTTGDNWDPWPTMNWQSLTQNTKWTIRIEITTAPSANNNISVDIQIALDVRE